MKKILSCILLLIFCYGGANAQKENNHWAFATRCGLDFNSGNAVIMLTNINTLEGSAAISDLNTGRLLFYTDGNRVYTRNHTVMPNGIVLTTDLTGPTTSTTQAAAITSVPGKYGQYYIFTLESGPTIHSHLYYSVVDMRLNNGLGDIVQGRKAVMLDSALTEKMAVVKGSNCDVWLMTRSLTASEYKAFHITNTGISTIPVISPVGVFTPNAYGIGEILFSHDGKKMVAASYLPVDMELYDFDAGTGILSNPVGIVERGYGVAFSPDDSKLYVSLGRVNQPDIIQYDLSVPTFVAINASRTVVATLPSGSYPLLSPGLWNIKMGGDGKMYFGAGQQMSVITRPDLAGTACAPVYNAITFPAGMSQYLGLPNPPVALPQQSSFTRVCGRDSVLLQAGVNGINYAWDDDPSGGAVRIVTHPGYYAVTYQVGCTAHIDSFYVQLYTDFPAVTAHASCANRPNGRLVLRNSTSDTATYRYTWTDSSNQVLRAASSNTGDSLTDLYPGLYRVTVTTGTGCDSVLWLTVPELPVDEATFLVDTVVCAGIPLLFTNTSAATVYSWAFGDGSGPVTVRNPVHVYTHAGLYQAALYTETDNGCTDTGIQTIRVYDLELTLSASDSIVKRGERVTLTTQGSDNYTVTMWQPATLFADQTEKRQVLTADSNMRIRVAAVSERGCVDTATLLLVVNPDLFLPTSFTPNGDGLNDLFRPRLTLGVQPSAISLSVFDRWGKEVWRGEGAAAYAGWDGSVAGRPGEIGTYFYLLQVRLVNSEQVTQQGSVTLIR